MDIITKLSLVVVVAVCILPSAFALGQYCQKCTEDPLQSAHQCNMSTTDVYCDDKCIALTAELKNGTVVGIRGCFPTNSGQCTSVSACNQRNGSLPVGVYFKRCVAECCDQARCNKNLFPMLPEPPSPSSVHVIASSSIASATQEPKGSPTSASIQTKAFLYFPIFLLIVNPIIS